MLVARNVSTVSLMEMVTSMLEMFVENVETQFKGNHINWSCPEDQKALFSSVGGSHCTQGTAQASSSQVKKSGHVEELCFVSWNRVDGQQQLQQPQEDFEEPGPWAYA
ncbi:hypothetical protein ACA910_003191 [Epithemia clementina (nom. ined.)]